MITLFAKWNSTDTGKAVDAVNRITNPSKLVAIALRARTMAARIAAVDKLDHQDLIKVVGGCGAILRSRSSMKAKDIAAELMIFIYNSTRSHELREKIQSYTGTIIGSYEKHSDYDKHVDGIDQIECANCPCTSEEHADRYVHFDSAEREYKRFSIP